MPDWTGVGVSIITCMRPLFGLPVVIAIILLVVNGNDPLSRMAAFFTLKPVVATPLWLAILALTDSFTRTGFHPGLVLSMLPGAILTLLIAWKFRSVFRGPQPHRALILLGLDGVRWTNTLVLLWAPSLDKSWYPTKDALALVAACVGLIMPTVYAYVALGVAIWRRKPRLASPSPAPVDAGHSLS